MTVMPLLGIGEVRAGDDLAAVLRGALDAAGLSPVRSDVLVVTQKIASKSQGRFVDLTSVQPGAEAEGIAATTRKDPRLVELVLRESSAIVRVAPGVLITRHRLGHVMANAGIDRSNLGAGGNDMALLLPTDPDGLAAQLGDELGCAVIISDSFGRPWRMGVGCVAIGAAGLPALLDRRGEHDRDGRPLEVTQIGLADMIANAAGLVMGEASEGVPAALVQGCAWTGAPRPAADLIRPLAEDLFA
ncbi:MAG: coenzyme F420-0:L-glutamate ligase [Sphingomonadales bacterium]|nr:coenzyme F420-0:L-glutamate ligase [Sphingomonadales bacterium]